ncbi:hypothetical protein ACF09Y_16890 [Streptomyces massasporeus]|uniref:hypothetical protein n=1 Tax=Streptomyces massasporeus TaxID=67324 RepID=UPI0036F855DE
MARSTIQEKFSGKAAINLPQILSIVDALAEYAQMHDTPLPKHETDREIWQDRVAAASKEVVAGQKKGMIQGSNVATPSMEWNIEPLRRAQMDDLVALIFDHRSKPVGDWLPRVLRVMTQAEMSVTDFLRKAAEDSPQGVVGTVAALHLEFPYEVDGPWGSERSQQNIDTVGRLITFSAQHHGDSAAPAIVVGLRRSHLGVYVEDFLTRVGTWFLPPSIENTVVQLRAAALHKDVEPVLKAIAKRKHDRIYEVVEHFGRNKWRPNDLNTILRAIGSHKAPQLSNIIDDFQSRNAPEDLLKEIARGVEYGNYGEYIEKFSQWGNQEFSDLLHQASEEPPF